MAVTHVPLVSQCADTHKIAFGIGSCRAISDQLRVNMLSVMPFMGEPCPTNNAGINGVDLPSYRCCKLAVIEVLV